ncbi:hypothetical protein B7486_67785 [cyanobacterium TDX16]|nr:hypothetical protein B7486_67785 [cyanobacterium TDX16]
MVSYEAAAEALDVAGLKARWSPDLGFATIGSEVDDVVGGAARELASAAGLALDEGPVVLTDPVRTWLTSGGLDLWLELEDGMWPGVADDLTAYSRFALEQTEGQTLPKLARTTWHRHQLSLDAARLFEQVDVVLCPTTAVPAFAAEGPPKGDADGVELDGAMTTPFTMLANLCWNPAISVPAGITSEGLPVGLQIIARRHADEVPLRLARIWEQTRPWPRFAPSSGLS